MKKALLTVSMALATAASAFAQNTYVAGQTATQGTVNPTALLQLLALAQEIFSRLVPFGVTAAVVAFFFFVVKFIFKGGEEGEARKKALSGMGWSILAIFLMVSIWGIIGLFGSLVGVGQGGTIPIPGVPRP
jgi:hypothetical protein